MEKVHVAPAITGRTCDHCVAAVKKALAAVPGVMEVGVALSPAAAGVSCDPSRTTVKMLTMAAAAEGDPSAPTSG